MRPLLAVAVFLVVAVAAGCGSLHVVVPSESMEPTVTKGERLAVDEVGDDYEPHVGDVVLFWDANDWLGPTAGEDGMLLKRVIGAPGDVVTCCDERGRVSVDGEVLDERYLADDPGACDAEINEYVVAQGTALRGPCDWTVGPVPDGKVFVLGDNRGHSADSRAYLCPEAEGPCAVGPWIDLDDVRGTVDVD